MSWLDKIKPSFVESNKEGKEEHRASVPEGLWKKCVRCDAVLYRPELEKNLDVCPKCQHHMRIDARRRLDIFLDEEGREELAGDVLPIDRLKFKDVKKYKDRLTQAQKATGEKEALVVMSGTLSGRPVVAAAFAFSFHGGSMGYAVGERFTRAANVALERKCPLICFSATGGARMQEALISLMQMAKTSAVIEKMKAAGLPYISVMTDPVYGGVSASLAMLGDVNIAEPNARAGFAGQNIIEQTIRQKLPSGFQRSEFLLERGAIDMIVARADMCSTIVRLIDKLMAYRQLTPEVAEPEATELEPVVEAEETVTVEAEVKSIITEKPQASVEVVAAAKTLQQWLDWLQQLHPVVIDLGLRRVEVVAKALELTTLNAVVITVAGTNGKGSTVAALRALLSSAPATSGSLASEKGRSVARVGVYTSPHLQRFNERIVIDNIPVTDAQICTALTEVDNARRRCRLADDQSGGPALSGQTTIPTLSYFEFTTLAALWLFKQAGLDYVLLEVGLGGRLDAVNIVDPALAIITRIGIDHQQWLGDSRDVIAREKAGILRPGISVVVGDTDPPESLQKCIDELSCEPYWLLPEPENVATSTATTVQEHPGIQPLAAAHGFEENDGRLYWSGVRPGRHGVLDRISVDDLPVSFPLHRHSWSCALQAAALIDALPGIETIKRLMQQTVLAGRQSEHCFKHRSFLLDVAHNEDSVDLLCQYLSNSRRPTASRHIAIFACMADKPVAPMLSKLMPAIDHWVFPELSAESRALGASEVYACWNKLLSSVPRVQPPADELAEPFSGLSMAKIALNVEQAIEWAIQHCTAKR